MFNPPGSTGNMSVSSVPFQPVAVMFFTDQAAITSVSQYFGVAAANAQWCMWTGIDQDAGGPMDERHRYLDSTHCIHLRQ